MAAAAARRWELDALRGLMLVLMTLTHLPTRFSETFGQPFGFVSAAEGFVLLSGYMAGQVYTAKHRHKPPEAMRDAFFKRALKIYLCQAALIVFAFTVIAFVGVLARQHAVTDLVSFYLEHPLTAFFSGLLLLYSPPLLDILPMYVLFMLISPLLLLHGLQRGWRGILVISALLWVAAQFELGRYVYQVGVSVLRLPVPFRETGAFEVFAWQLVWVLGLWQGSRAATDPDQPLRFPRWVVRTAWAVFLTGLVWRHAIGQTPFPGLDWANLANLLFDKWRIGPLRLLDLFSLIVLTVHYAEPLKRRLPRLHWLETMGSASLPVFCAHLVLALSALALVGAIDLERPVGIDLAILAVSFPVLWAVAWTSQQLDRRAAALKERHRQRRQLRLSA